MKAIPEPSGKPSQDAQEALMRCAHKFGLAFDEGRQFADGQRLEYTLATWRNLALAAVQYAKEVQTPS